MFLFFRAYRRGVFVFPAQTGQPHFFHARARINRRFPHMTVGAFPPYFFVLPVATISGVSLPFIVGCHSAAMCGSTVEHYFSYVVKILKSFPRQCGLQIGSMYSNGLFFYERAYCRRLSKASHKLELIIHDVAPKCYPLFFGKQKRSARLPKDQTASKSRPGTRGRRSAPRAAFPETEDTPEDSCRR